MARVLIVGCGCRGQGPAGPLAAEGHAVRGTSRDPSRRAAIEASGAEAVTADPDRLATLIPAIEGVAVVCWLMGTSSDDPNDPLHGPRLAPMLEHLVGTPGRGLVDETGGAHRPPGLEATSRAGRPHSGPGRGADAHPAGAEGGAPAPR